MKLEELLECSADKIESLSDKDLEAILLPYFPKTRPEMVVREERKEAKPKVLSPEEVSKIAKRKRAEELVRRMGIKLNI
jgi:hypothetical protein